MEVEQSRRALVTSVERIAMTARYAACGIFALLYAVGQAQGWEINFAILVGVLLVHNALYHGVVWAGREHLFRTPLNFVICLAEASLAVKLTGAEQSILFVTYVLLLIGVGAYSRRFFDVLSATALCCAAYAMVLLTEWQWSSMSGDIGPVIAQFMIVIVAGLLVGRVMELLWRAEQGFLMRARAQASSEESMRLILNSAATPILVFDEREFIADVNSRACEYLAAPRNQLIGQRIRTFLFDDGTLLEKLAALRGEGEYHGEMILVDAEGEEHTAEIIVRSFMRDDKRLSVLIVHDLTEPKRLQEAMQAANARLERLNRELEQVSQLRSGFFASVSQRLRSPLSVILGYGEMLLNDELGELTTDQRKALHACKRNALRAIRLIDEALDTGMRGAAQPPSVPPSNMATAPREAHAPTGPSAPPPAP